MSELTAHYYFQVVEDSPHMIDMHNLHCSHTVTRTSPSLLSPQNSQSPIPSSTSSTMASMHVYFFLLILLSNGSTTTDAESSDVLLLLSKIKPAFQGRSDGSETTNFELSSWNTSVPICQWRGLKWSFANGASLNCSDPHQKVNLSIYKDPSLQLVSLHLPASGLSGSIPKEIGELSSLQSLFLAANSLTGFIPLEVGNNPSLSELDLGGNLLDGSLPISIWNLCDRIVSIRLNGNRLVGFVPEPAVPNATCENLQLLDLGENRLRGSFPLFITGFHGLRELNLGNNLFSGQIPPEISELQNLKRLNLSYNNFTGTIPVVKESKFGPEAFQGNEPSLCGAPSRQCGPISSGPSSGLIAGTVIGLMAGAVVIASLSIGYVQGRKRKHWGIVTGEENEFEEDEECGNGFDGKLLVFEGGEHLTLEDVLNATGQVMEKTSYGTVYKAKLADGGTIALRLLREGSCKDRRSCLPVIRQLGRARHENLILLRAFYQGRRGEKLLIFDYLPSRSLHDLLHENRAGRPVLNWARRHKIALGIAKGLAYLHTGMEDPITHGNIRSKNVLVDEFFVARLVEYGVDKLMVPAVTDELVSAMKSDGYKPPELQKMKNCNTRTDVYSFGILLLEILMGRKPGKDEKCNLMVDLPALVKAAVLEETTVEVFDVEVLKGVRSPVEEGLVQALKLAMGCCAPVASVRPDMDEVVKQLEENRPRNRSALYSPAETRSEIGTPF